MSEPLVFDVGMHRGEDTGYYLARGCRVVAVDADERRIAEARETFAPAVAQGRLRLVHCAVAEVEGDAEFHVSDQTLWSSLDPEVSTRDGQRSRSVRVPTRRLDSLFGEHGVPRYCKIDIEGWDLVALRSLAGTAAKPAFISVESECVSDSADPGEAEVLATLDELARLGYRRFKLVDQRSLTVLSPEVPVYWERPPAWRRIARRLGLGGYTHYNLVELAANGRAALSARHGYAFPEGASGPYGEELAGTWLDHAAARATLLRHRRDYFRIPGAKRYGFWCDWHATT